MRNRVQYVDVKNSSLEAIIIYYPDSFAVCSCCCEMSFSRMSSRSFICPEATRYKKLRINCQKMKRHTNNNKINIKNNLMKNSFFGFFGHFMKRWKMHGQVFFMRAKNFFNVHQIVAYLAEHWAKWVTQPRRRFYFRRKQLVTLALIFLYSVTSIGKNWKQYTLSKSCFWHDLVEPI